ncbi:MAG: hypothetical protein EHM20_00515 [Alphaproteobacteria bacterium]|nr:MAG: hypothetical protein EHM20_00515 [Alphaproteobacteria bacterium]
MVAGSYKAMPYLHLPPIINLTVVFGGITVLGILTKITKGINERNLRIHAVPKRFIIPFVLLSILMLISLFYTKAPIYGTDKFLRFITLTALATFAPIIILENIGSIRRFFYILVFISLAMSIDSIVSSKIITGFHPALGSNYLAWEESSEHPY